MPLSSGGQPSVIVAFSEEISDIANIHTIEAII
jgi:hypothetical protein